MSRSLVKSNWRIFTFFWKVQLKEIPAKYKKIDDSKVLLVNHCYIPSDYQKPFAVSARAILNGLLEKGIKLLNRMNLTSRRLKAKNVLEGYWFRR